MIFIVGAGVSGLILSLFLLEEGNNVIILEKEKKIKSSVCGEACDIASLSLIPFDSSPYFERRINGIKFVFDGEYFYAKVDGVVLNRQKWLEGMAHEVVKRGGEIKFSQKVIRIDKSYIFTHDDKFKYDVCIGADGPLSVARKHIGGKCRICVGSQYEIEYKKDDNFLDFYVSRKYSRHYAWVFPKKNSINVGVIGKFSDLNSFIEDLNLKGRIISKGAGIIPYGGIKKFVRENVAVIGDAACMVNPFSLGGISPSIHAAKILAKNIDDLEKYEKEIKKHAIMDKILIKGKKAVENITDREIKNIFKYIKGKELRDIRYRDFIPLLFYPLSITKFYRIGRALIHSLKWGW